MKNIFNLFKKKKVEEEKELYNEFFIIGKHYVKIKEVIEGSFRYRVHLDNSDSKLLVDNHADSSNEAYSKAYDFIERINNVEPIILEILFNSGHVNTYIINEYSAGVILEDHKDNKANSIDFHDYSSGKYFSFDKTIIKFLILDGYYE